MAKRKIHSRGVLKTFTGAFAKFGVAVAPEPVSKAVIAALRMIFEVATGAASRSQEERRAKQQRRVTQDDVRELLESGGLGVELRAALAEAQIHRDEIQTAIEEAAVELSRKLDEKTPDPSELHATLLDFVQASESLRGLADELRRQITAIPILWDAEKQRTEARAEYEQAYLNEITRTLGDLELLGVDHADLPDNQRYSLDVGYITLNVSRPRETEGALFEAADELLLIQPRLAVVGPAGSGKTTLLQWAAVQCAAGEVFKRGPRTGDQNPWHGCVPYLIRLRRCTTGGETILPPLAEWAKATLPDWKEDHPSDWVRKTIEENRAILMIDGVDELPPKDREKLWRELEQQTRRRDRLRVYVTSRELGDDPRNPGQWKPPSDMSVARLQPLNDTQIDLLIDQWFEAKGDERRPAPSAALARLAGSLKQELRRDAIRWVRQLAETPFLCAVISLVYYHRKGHLPENRAKLYNHCCRALLKLRDLQSGVSTDEDFDLLSDDELMELHGRVALNMLLCPTAEEPPTPKTRKKRPKSTAAESRDEEGRYRVEAERDNVLVWLNEAIANVKSEVVRERLHRPGAKPEQVTQDTDLNAFLDHLKLRRALLREPTAGRIDFHHRALLDYLAAYAVPVCRKLDMLIERSDDDRWREVILLAPGGGRIGDEGIERLINGLVDKAEQTGSKRCIALAVGCFDTAVPALTDLKQRALKLLDKALPPDNFDEAEALTAAGAELVRRLTFDPIQLNKIVSPRGRVSRIGNRRAAACVRALRRIGGDDALSAIRRFVQIDEDPVAAELLAVAEINPLELPAVVRYVSTMRPQTPATILRINDLTPLSGLSELQELFLSDLRVSDLRPLSGLRKLRDLYLHSTGVSDLTPLSGLRRLNALGLGGTLVSDLRPISGLSRLRWLYLADTPLSDVSPLSGLSWLQELYLQGTAVSDLTPLIELPNVKFFIDADREITVPREMEHRVERQ